MLLLNPFTWFVSLREKLLALAAVILLSLGMGWHFHTVWDDYLDTSVLRSQLARAQAVPGKQSAFHQKLQATPDVKTPCFSTPMSPSLLKLVR